jgi:transcriptional regulator with XRE-family HTH domain
MSTAAAHLTLGEIIRDARVRLGWSLRAAERATGIPNAHISQIETRTIECPGIPVLAKLAKAYGLSLHYLAESAGRDMTAVTLVEDALFLRMNGERPPGAPRDPRAETWAAWDQRAEEYLRSLA